MDEQVKIIKEDKYSIFIFNEYFEEGGNTIKYLCHTDPYLLFHVLRNICNMYGEFNQIPLENYIRSDHPKLFNEYISVKEAFLECNYKELDSFYIDVLGNYTLIINLKIKAHSKGIFDIHFSSNEINRLMNLKSEKFHKVKYSLNGDIGIDFTDNNRFYEGISFGELADIQEGNNDHYCYDEQGELLILSSLKSNLSKAKLFLEHHKTIEEFNNEVDFSNIEKSILGIFKNKQ